jgi:hypothetical protein
MTEESALTRDGKPKTSGRRFSEAQKHCGEQRREIVFKDVPRLMQMRDESLEREAHFGAARVRYGKKLSARTLAILLSMQGQELSSSTIRISIAGITKPMKLSAGL